MDARAPETLTADARREAILALMTRALVCLHESPW